MDQQNSDAPSTHGKADDAGTDAEDQRAKASPPPEQAPAEGSDDVPPREEGSPKNA